MNSQKEQEHKKFMASAKSVVSFFKEAYSDLLVELLSDPSVNEMRVKLADTVMENVIRELNPVEGRCLISLHAASIFGGLLQAIEEDLIENATESNEPEPEQVPENGLQPIQTIAERDDWLAYFPLDEACDEYLVLRSWSGGQYVTHEYSTLTDEYSYGHYAPDFSNAQQDYLARLMGMLN